MIGHDQAPQLRMDQSAYWAHLEYRVCRELDGLRHTTARGLWCDGFLPILYLLDDDPPRILGRAWMGIGPGRQEEWEFTLILGRRFDSPDAVDWSALLPPADVTRWLTVEPDRKQLTMEPTSAVPDRSG